MNKYNVTYGLIVPQDQASEESHILPITKIIKPLKHSRYFLTCGRDGTVIKHTKNNKKYDRYRMQIHSDWVTDLVEVADEKYIAVSQDFSICLLTLHEKDESWESKIIGYHDDYVKCVRRLPSSETHEIRFVTCGLDKRLKIWVLKDTNTSILLHTFNNDQSNDTGSLYALDTVHDASLPFDIVAGDNNGNILFLCGKTGAKVAIINSAHEANIKVLKVMDDNRNLITTSADGMIKLWKLSDVLKKGSDSLIHAWKWSCPVWCIEGDNSQSFYVGDSRGLITKVVMDRGDWSTPSLSTFCRTEKDGEGGILAMHECDDGDFWFSRSGNSNLVIKKADSRIVEIVQGGFALLKCCLLTNRRHVITQNTRGEVQRWDIVSCTLLDTFNSSMGTFNDLVKLYNTKEILPHWCSVSIKTGKLFVKLSQKFLSTEVYGSALQQYNLINKIELSDDERYNLGRIVINSILDEFIAYELEKDKQFRKELVTRKSSAPGTPQLVSQSHIPTDPPQMDAARPSIKEKRRLSLFTKFTSNSASNSQQLTPTSLPNTPMLERSNPLIGEEHTLSTPPATAPLLPDSTQRESFDPLPPSAMQPEGRSASSGSLLTRKLRMFSSNNNNTNESCLSDENEAEPENNIPSEDGPLESSNEGNLEEIKFKFSSKNFNGNGFSTVNANNKGKPTGNEISTNPLEKKREFMSDFMEELREGYTKQNVSNSSSLRLLSKKLPESKITRDYESPIIELTTGVLLVVNCWKEGACGDTVCYSTYLPAPQYENKSPEEDSHKTQIFESLEANLPYWIAEALFKDEKIVKEYPKLSFIIKPWEDPSASTSESSSEQIQQSHHHHHLSFYKSKTLEPHTQMLPHIAEANTKLNAPSMIKVKKIMRYVVDRFETRTPEMKTKADISEWLEILCKGQVLDTDMTLSTVRTLFWKSQGDIILEYRRKALNDEKK
ncbi:LAFE_0C08526g1_1 [Lachancea fermentati]|uniref:LAFE_0C08526g1_1 n=1 Tax=Lachancea fermentati TaxID=4955 RepID=A0A1G4M9U0_LACFM|nr:LAFE_0C08526g1_1 [Lachancea fermentati]